MHGYDVLANLAWGLIRDWRRRRDVDPTIRRAWMRLYVGAIRRAHGRAARVDRLCRGGNTGRRGRLRGTAYRSSTSIQSASNRSSAPPLPSNRSGRPLWGRFALGRPGTPAPRIPAVLDTVGLTVSHRLMRSQLAEAARRSLTEDVKRMTPEQRLAAFLAHCHLMAQLQSAGGTVQQRPRRVAARDAD